MDHVPLACFKCDRGMSIAVQHKRERERERERERRKKRRRKRENESCIDSHLVQGSFGSVTNRLSLSNVSPPGRDLPYAICENELLCETSASHTSIEHVMCQYNEVVPMAGVIHLRKHSNANVRNAHIRDWDRE